ncbi:helix-turn-helix transcriptional regulator [Agaribacter flavus]|uniref:Helix-turn-helix transcriptional regulator n=1 Tax=Agaribacter flavus TaxID=1902781 RepID=A0ABV7FM76_9ALTE
MLNLSANERRAIINKLEQSLMNGEEHIGIIIKSIRTELYGMTQTQYAKFVKVSDKTLRDIEKGNTDPRISVVNKLLKPGGFRLSARKAAQISL